VLTVSFCPSCCCDWQVSYIKVKVKWSRYRPGMALRMGRGIALLFRDRDIRRAWVVSSMHRPHFTPGKDPVPILQEAGRAPRPVWTGGKFRPHWNRSRTVQPVFSRYTDWATRPKDFLYNRYISFLPSHLSIHLNQNDILKMEALSPFNLSSGSRRRISKETHQTHVIKEVFPSLWK